MDLRTKCCRVCKQEKQVRNFLIRNKKTGNRRTECKLCLYIKNKDIDPNSVSTISYLDKIIEPKKKKIINGKKCKQCSRYKKNDEYYKSRVYIRKICKKCTKKNRNKYYDNNKDLVCEQVKKYRNNNPDKILERNRKYRVNNEEKIKNYNKEYCQYYKNNFSENIKASSNRIRAIRENVEGTFSKDELKDVYLNQKGKCFYCNCELSYKYHADHYIPISRGGTNYINNIVCSCAKCNLSKNKKLPEEYLEYVEKIKELSVK